jgi:hypothetical protein
MAMGRARAPPRGSHSRILTCAVAAGGDPRVLLPPARSSRLRDHECPPIVTVWTAPNVSGSREPGLFTGLRRSGGQHGRMAEPQNRNARSANSSEVRRRPASWRQRNEATARGLFARDGGRAMAGEGARMAGDPGPTLLRTESIGRGWAARRRARQWQSGWPDRSRSPTPGAGGSPACPKGGWSGPGGSPAAAGSPRRRLRMR